jgi:hypothetical protein
VQCDGEGGDETEDAIVGDETEDAIVGDGVMGGVTDLGDTKR